MKYKWMKPKEGKTWVNVARLKHTLEDVMVDPLYFTENSIFLWLRQEELKILAKAGDDRFNTKGEPNF